MAESALVRDPCIISWQSHINNTARNAKCWVLVSPTRTLNRCNPRLAALPFCSTKSAARAGRLASESFAWSFFYVPLPLRMPLRSRDLMIIGSSGTQRKGARRLSERIHLWVTRGRWLGARHIRNRTQRQSPSLTLAHHSRPPPLV